MAEVDHTPQLIHFGVFELDMRAGELRKKGVRVKLQEQPFQILVMLLEHPGQVVTREGLHQKLWPEGTFVDFEHGLNAAVNRLRDALDDSPENSRFVETLPRRGYRFIAPVEGVSVSPPARTLRASWARPAWGVGLTLMALAVLVGMNVGGLRDRLLGGPAPEEITSIAVLPLENLSGDPEQDYFADGMTEALITELSKISALRVISRQSVSQFKGTNKPLPEIARELDVDAVVEGSAVHVGPAVGGTSDRVRISAQLIQAVPERHLWAESYERDLRDVLALQSEMARAIAREVKATLTPEEEARLASARPVNPEAYEAFLKGRYFYHKRTEEGLRKGLEYYQQAIAKDPTYAPAHLGAADSYLVMAGWALIPPTEAYVKARAAVMKALEIDETLGHAHSNLAGIRYEYEWDWLGAEREFKRALELNPNRVGIHRYHAEFLSFMGRHTEAIAEAERAHELRPLQLITYTMVGITLHNARQYDQAIEQCQEVLELDPNFVPALYYLGRAYEQKGQYEEAITHLAEARRISGASSRMAAGLAHAYALSGRRADAQQILDELTRRPSQSYVSPYEVGIVFVGLGDGEQALTWLDRAVEERDTYAVHLKVDPRLDPLRSDPRFHSLLRRMNFPEN